MNFLSLVVYKQSLISLFKKLESGDKMRHESPEFPTDFNQFYEMFGAPLRPLHSSSCIGRGGSNWRGWNGDVSIEEIKGEFIHVLFVSLRAEVTRNKTVDLKIIIILKFID